MIISQMQILLIFVRDAARNNARLEQAGQQLVELCHQRIPQARFSNLHSSSDQAEIEEKLRHAASLGPLVFTLGGSGIGPNDFTPEATRSVCQREIPGVGELMRQGGAEITEKAWMGRTTAGILDSTLIVNLPGRSKALRENFEICSNLVFHVVKQLGKM